MGGSRFIQADGLKDVVLEVLWLTMKRIHVDAGRI